MYNAAAKCNFFARILEVVDTFCLSRSYCNYSRRYGYSVGKQGTFSDDPNLAWYKLKLHFWTYFSFNFSGQIDADCILLSWRLFAQLVRFPKGYQTFFQSYHWSIPCERILRAKKNWFSHILLHTFFYSTKKVFNDMSGSTNFVLRVQIIEGQFLWVSLA